MIVMTSMFRNAVDLLPRYFAQVEALAERVPGLRLSLCWGDSTDDTRGALLDYASGCPVPSHLFESSHGGPEFGSVVDDERFRQLSIVINAMLEHIEPRADKVIYMEADLIWDTPTLFRLLSQDKDVVAPGVYREPTFFYDTWAFRDVNGKHFGHSDRPSGEVSSVGSCFVMRGEVARRCRVHTDEAVVGLCRDIRAKGYKIFVDGQATVWHPPVGASV